MSSARNDIAIREVGRAESQALAEIHRQCFPHYWNQDDFTGFFDIKGTLALVAQTPELAGMIVCRLQFEDAEVLTMAVRPAWRRQGIARALLEEAVRRAVAFGAVQMFLDVEEGNVAAQSLYETSGFNHLRRRKQYYRHTDGSFTDALVMFKKLSVASGQLPV